MTIWEYVTYMNVSGSLDRGSTLDRENDGLLNTSWGACKNFSLEEYASQKELAQLTCVRERHNQTQSGGMDQ
nr:hypothetical protein [Tanacetum cinerariifolium]